MSEEIINNNPTENSPQDGQQEKGATGVDIGSKYNQAPPSAPTVFNVGGVMTTKDDASKASAAIDNAILKKIEELVKAEKFEEALVLAEKIKKIPLKQKIKFALEKGVIKPPSIQPDQKIVTIDEDHLTPSI